MIQRKGIVAAVPFSYPVAPRRSHRRRRSVVVVVSSLTTNVKGLERDSELGPLRFWTGRSLSFDLESVSGFLSFTAPGRIFQQEQQLRYVLCAAAGEYLARRELAMEVAGRDGEDLGR